MNFPPGACPSNPGRERGRLLGQARIDLFVVIMIGSRQGFRLLIVDLLSNRSVRRHHDWFMNDSG
jgi:hypothetical protein